MRDDVCSITLEGFRSRDCTKTAVAQRNIFTKIGAAATEGRRGDPIVQCLRIDEMVVPCFATPCK